MLARICTPRESDARLGLLNRVPISLAAAPPLGETPREAPQRGKPGAAPTSRSGSSPLTCPPRRASTRWPRSARPSRSRCWCTTPGSPTTCRWPTRRLRGAEPRTGDALPHRLKAGSTPEGRQHARRQAARQRQCSARALAQQRKERARRRRVAVVRAPHHADGPFDTGRHRSTATPGGGGSRDGGRGDERHPESLADKREEANVAAGLKADARNEPGPLAARSETAREPVPSLTG